MEQRVAPLVDGLLKDSASGATVEVINPSNGKQLLQYAGQSNMKVVLLECAGKSPQIVFDDGVDIDAAA